MLYHSTLSLYNNKYTTRETRNDREKLVYKNDGISRDLPRAATGRRDEYAVAIAVHTKRVPTPAEKRPTAGRQKSYASSLLQMALVRHEHMRRRRLSAGQKRRAHVYIYIYIRNI